MAIVERNIKRKDGKKSVYFYVEIKLPNGKKLKRSVGVKGLVTKTQARLYEQNLRRKIKLGQLDLLDADIPTLNDFRSNTSTTLETLNRKDHGKGMKNF